MTDQLDAVRRELRGGELVPLKHTRDIVPVARPQAPATPEPRRSAAGPRRIRVERTLTSRRAEAAPSLLSSPAPAPAAVDRHTTPVM